MWKVKVKGVLCEKVFYKSLQNYIKIYGVFFLKWSLWLFACNLQSQTRRIASSWKLLLLVSEKAWLRLTTDIIQETLPSGENFQFPTKLKKNCVTHFFQTRMKRISSFLHFVPGWKYIYVVQQMLEENKSRLKYNERAVTVQDSKTPLIQKSLECNENRMYG